MMSHNPKKLNTVPKASGQEPPRAELLDEFPALPEKFFTFTHEMIALLWMSETASTPVRGTRPRRK